MSDETHLPVQNELYCFLPGNSDRPCTAECTAFKTVGPDNDRLDPAQQHCVLLTSIERVGNGVNVLAAVAGSWFKAAKNTAADARREAAGNKMPDPMGRRG